MFLRRQRDRFEVDLCANEHHGGGMVACPKAYHIAPPTISWGSNTPPAQISQTNNKEINDGFLRGVSCTLRTKRTRNVTITSVVVPFAPPWLLPA